MLLTDLLHGNTQLCGVLLPWLVVGMVAHVPAVMMCDMVSARYAALCARSGALT
ncbi:hypothetical protein ABMC83_000160 [Escherichia coli]